MLKTIPVWAVDLGEDNVRHQGRLFSTPDDNLLFVGTSYYMPAQDSGYVALIKLDLLGNVLEHRELYLYGLAITYDAIQVSDGYILTGKFIAGINAAFVMKIGNDLEVARYKGPEGFEITSEQFGTVILADNAIHVFSSNNPGHSETHKLTIGQDGENWQLMTSTTADSSEVRVFDAISTGVPNEFIALGYIEDQENFNYEIHIMRYNANGGTWTKRIHFNLGDYGSPSGLRKTNDGNYLLTVKNSSTAESLFSSYILKMDVDGNVIWFKSYTKPNTHILLGISLEMDNGDLLVAGIEGQALIPILSRMDSQGNIIWTRTWSSAIPESIGIMDLLKLSDGSFRMLTGGYHVGITALDSEGIGCGFSDTGAITSSPYVLDISNYGFVSTSDTIGNTDRLYFNRNFNYTSLDDCTLTIGVDEYEKESIQVYPNPAEDWIEMRDQESIHSWTYNIYDTQGRLLDSGLTRRRVDISRLSPGAMLIHLTHGNQHMVERLVKH